MKVDFNQKILNLEGKPMRNKMNKEITLEYICAQVLCMFAEKDVTGQERFKRFILAEKIIKHDGDLDLPVEDVALLKELIGKTYIPLIVGRAFRILEENNEKKVDE